MRKRQPSRIARGTPPTRANATPAIANRARRSSQKLAIIGGCHPDSGQEFGLGARRGGGRVQTQVSGPRMGGIRRAAWNSANAPCFSGHNWALASFWATNCPRWRVAEKWAADAHCCPRAPANWATNAHGCSRRPATWAISLRCRNPYYSPEEPGTSKLRPWIQKTQTAGG